MSKVASLRALAARISTKLGEHGIRTVLCGGSCVTIYAKGRYATRDFDFVLSGGYPDREVAAALAELGYRGVVEEAAPCHSEPFAPLCHSEVLPKNLRSLKGKLREESSR